MKKITSIFTVILIALLCIIPSYATESLVEYNNASDFVFNPTDKNLFQDFKGIMPGDKKTQEIVVKNTKAKTPVTLYLRAEVDEASKEFLNQIDIEVYISPSKDSKTKTLLQSSSAAEEGDLVTDVKLGTFMPNESGYITVMIYVHPEMNNKYKNQLGKIKWIFSAEEGYEIVTLPSTPISRVEPTTISDGEIIGEQENPKTGVSYIAAGIAVSVIGIAIVVLILTNKKSKDSEENET